MKVLFAVIFLASSLYISNAFTLPNFFNLFLNFDNHNEIEDSSQNWDKHGFIDTQRQSRGESHESYDTEGLSGYQHQDTKTHHYAEDDPSNVTEHILPVFLIAFFASIANSLFLSKSAAKTGTIFVELSTFFSI